MDGKEEMGLVLFKFADTLREIPFGVCVWTNMDKKYWSIWYFRPY